MTTATESATTAFDVAANIAQLRTLSASKAFALYDLASATRVPIVAEIAAHALAAALERALEEAETLQRNQPAAAPVAPISPAESEPVSVSDELPPLAPVAPISPAPDLTTATRKADKPARQSAPKTTAATKLTAADDLAATLKDPPRNKAAAGAFHCVWADGTCTTVTGVVYHSGKPETRWAAAFQAADRLRRTRARHAYAESLAQSARLVGRWEERLGVTRETTAWWNLVRVMPMPHLLAVFDDATREEYQPLATFGAGDPDQARALEAAMTIPHTPWQDAALQSEGWTTGRAHAYGDPVYYASAIRLTVGGGAYLQTGWSPAQVAMQRAHALEAFSPEQYGPPAPVEVKTAEAAAPVGATSLADLDGGDVVISPDHLLKLEADSLAAEVAARTTAEEAEEALDAIKAEEAPDAADLEAATTALRAARRAHALAMEAHDRLVPMVTYLKSLSGGERLTRWTVRRGPGGLTMELLASDGRRVCTRPDVIAGLALAA